MERQPIELPDPETLFAAALYLATSYARTGCPLLCRMLARQLACIQHHPSESVPDALRETCRKLREEWERIATERAQELREVARVDKTSAPLLH